MLFVAPESTVTRYLGAEAAQRFLANRARIPWLTNFSTEDFVLAMEGQRRQALLVRALRDTGAGLLAGTDLGPWGSTLHRELALLVAAGLTPAEALQTATFNPARFFKATDTLDIESAGRRADLGLLDADPLLDIRNTTRIADVFVGGRRVTLADVARRRP
jgi:imidazolonepropionase-like amidohydrolase